MIEGTQEKIKRAGGDPWAFPSLAEKLLDAVQKKQGQKPQDALTDKEGLPER